MRKKKKGYLELEREREIGVVCERVCVEESWRKKKRERERHKMSIYTVYTLTKAHTRKSVSTLQ